MWELLLSSVAVALGWITARRHYNRRSNRNWRGWSSGYFQGLNYLLNEQPDKAIEIFTRMAEIDGETVEIQLALGNLFRRRGEVSRAIRLHQDIFTRSDLDREQRTQAFFELGQDYMRAGLFDRAESLFLELIEMDAHTVPALRYLVDIYQQEKDWKQAISCLQRLGIVTGEAVEHGVSHYYCELVEDHIEKGEYPQARALLGQALHADPHCVRASLLESRMAVAIGDHEAAVAALHRVEHQNPDFLGEIIEPLREGYAALQIDKELENYLKELLKNYKNTALILENTELVRTHLGILAAIQFLTDSLRQCPSIRGVKFLLELDLARHQEEPREHLQVINHLIGRLLTKRPLYSCSQCGFTGRALHWQCPSCKSWSTVCPIQGMED